MFQVSNSTTSFEDRTVWLLINDTSLVVFCKNLYVVNAFYEKVSVKDILLLVRNS